MNLIVFVPLILSPTPCANLTNFLAKPLSHTSFSSPLIRWIYSSMFPEMISNTEFKSSTYSVTDLIVTLLWVGYLCVGGFLVGMVVGVGVFTLWDTESVELVILATLGKMNCGTCGGVFVTLGKSVGCALVPLKIRARVANASRRWCLFDVFGGDYVRKALVNSFAAATTASFVPNVGCSVFSGKHTTLSDIRGLPVSVMCTM